MIIITIIKHQVINKYFMMHTNYQIFLYWDKKIVATEFITSLKENTNT